MTNRMKAAWFCLFWGLAWGGDGEGNVTARAEGTFEVELKPVELAVGDDRHGGMSIDKKYSGDLEGTGKGMMLTAMTPVQGSAGYVAIERVSGTLHGRQGAFTIQHSGTMDRGEPRLIISVVPDSGEGALKGIAGSMAIVIENGVHSYVFEYVLPASEE